MLNVSAMNEKPKASYAEEFLGVRNAAGEKEYYSVFGQYILTAEVFEQLAADIASADATEAEQRVKGEQAAGGRSREIELTAALEAVRQKSGMMGVRLNGTMYDMGNPAALRQCVVQFSKPNADE